MIWLIPIVFFLFASTFVAGEISVAVSSPFFFIGTRMLAAGILMLGYTAIAQPKQLRVSRSDWPLFGVLALMLIFIPYVTEFWALQYISGAKSALLWNLTPFITAIFAYYMFGEKMTIKKLSGLVIGFLGFIPILISQQPKESILSSFNIFSTAEIVLIIGVVAGSFGWIIVKKALDRGYPIFVINGYSTLFSGLLSLICSGLFEGPWKPVPVTNMQVYLSCLIFLVIIGNVVCYNLYGLLLKKYTATFISFTGFTTPLFAAVIQYFVLGEPVSIYFYLTVVIVGIGLYMFYREELRQGYFAD